jgi:prefoldin alpha subunit
LSLFEQQTQQIQQQLELLEQGIIELTTLNSSLDELIGKKDKEILANIGNGLFVKAKLISEDLIVDIGGKNFIKKDIPKTKDMISEQIKRLNDLREQLTHSLDEINNQIGEIIMDFQANSQENKED